MITTHLPGTDAFAVAAHTFKRPFNPPERDCWAKRGGLVSDETPDVTGHGTKRPIVEDDVEAHGKKFPLVMDEPGDSGTRHPLTDDSGQRHP